jgi:hypothetical protein
MLVRLINQYRSHRATVHPWVDRPSSSGRISESRAAMASRRVG